MTPTILVPPHLQPDHRLRPYKKALYDVTGACLIEATLETGILYRPLQGDGASLIWMRPANAFDEMVDTAQGPIRRFEAQP